MQHYTYEAHTLTLSPFTLIACESGSVFHMRWLCLREIVICPGSGHVGPEDRVSDSFSPVLYPDLSRSFSCQWKVVRTSPSSLSTFVTFTIFLWCGCEDGGAVSCCSHTGGPSGGLLREHIVWRKRGQSCSWKLCSLGTADEGCWHSPLPNLAELSSSLISAHACEIFWLGSLHKAIIPSGIPLYYLISPICWSSQRRVSSPGAAGGRTTWGPELWRAPVNLYMLDCFLTSIFASDSRTVWEEFRLWSPTIWRYGEVGNHSTSEFSLQLSNKLFRQADVSIKAGRWREGRWSFADNTCYTAIAGTLLPIMKASSFHSPSSS